MAALSTAFSRGQPSATQSALLQTFKLYGGAYSLGTWQKITQFLPSLHGGEGSSFPGLVPPNDMVGSECVVGIKCGDSGVMIGYQVDEFTCTWSTKWFVAHAHIYPGFMGKVSSPTHFPLESWCEDYFFLVPSGCQL